jgi:xylose isomerase
MDAFALGLIKAAAIIEDGRIDEFVRKRYASYRETEIGKKILANETNLEELSSYAEALGKVENVESGSQEKLQSILNSVLFR